MGKRCGLPSCNALGKWGGVLWFEMRFGMSHSSPLTTQSFCLSSPLTTQSFCPSIASNAAECIVMSMLYRRHINGGRIERGALKEMSDWASLRFRKDGNISIVFEDLSRNFVFFSNRSEAL